MLPFASWPAEDQNRWEAAFKSGDRFDESGRGAHLAPSTRKARQGSYGRFLRFLSANHHHLLSLPPEERIDPRLVAEYVSWRRTLCGDISIAIDLGFLCGALQFICPDTDFSWLLTITRRVAATAPQKPTKYHLVTSDRLYSLGIELMDFVVTDAAAANRTRTSHAFQFRDGLIIAFLALIPLRSRTLAALRIGRHLIKVGDLWELDIPASDTKTRRPLDYPISEALSARIDLYLERFRVRISGADKHTSLWSSNQSQPMCPHAIYAAVRRRPKNPLDSVSTYIASAMLQRAFGRAMIQSTCEASRTFSAKHRLLRLRNTTSWHNRALRGVPSLGPSAMREKDSVFLILFRKFGEHQTTNLGVRSSNLFGRAR